MAFSSKTTAVETHNANVSNVMVTLATALSTSFPRPGSEGKATLSEHLAELLQDKSLPLTELSLLYCYRFGFGIADALKFVGFNGKLQEFVEEQQCFLVMNGCVSLRDAIADDVGQALQLVTVNKDVSTVSDDQCDDDSTSATDTGSTTDTEGCQCDLDSDIDLGKWKLLGGRIAAALHDCDDEDDESFSTADAEAESRQLDVDDEIDIAKWQHLGGRIAAALRAHDEEEQEQEVDRAPDPKAWCNVGHRIATALKDCEDDCFLDSPDPAAWHNVGCRLTAAFKNCDQD